MLADFLNFCGSYQGQILIAFFSDLAIAIAYFAIPLIMIVVLRDRRGDIPYPWLWTLFVTFIVACGLTHVAHVWSAYVGAQQAWLHATIGAFTAAASVGTAVAFAFIVPEIRNLPSPWQQKEELERLVKKRTHEKDRLIMEINHRVGNQIQVLSSLVSIEMRKVNHPEARAVLERFKEQLTEMGNAHVNRSEHDFLVGPSLIPE